MLKVKNILFYLLLLAVLQSCAQQPATFTAKTSYDLEKLDLTANPRALFQEVGYNNINRLTSIDDGEALFYEVNHNFPNVAHFGKLQFNWLSAISTTDSSLVALRADAEIEGKVYSKEQLDAFVAAMKKKYGPCFYECHQEDMSTHYYTWKTKDLTIQFSIEHRNITHSDVEYIRAGQYLEPILLIIKAGQEKFVHSFREEKSDLDVYYLLKSRKCQ